MKTFYTEPDCCTALNLNVHLNEIITRKKHQYYATTEPRTVYRLSGNVDSNYAYLRQYTFIRKREEGYR